MNYFSFFIIKELKSVNNPNSVHGIYPYRGKISALDAEQILSQMPTSSVVLDPFCGSGTIVYEGLRFGHKTIGIDANPIAVVLSKGKISIPVKIEDVNSELELYIKKCSCREYDGEIPEYPKSLFHEKSINQIMNMAQFYEEMSDYLKACFSIFIGQQYYFIINQLTVVDVLVVLSLSSTTFYKIVALRSLAVVLLVLSLLHIGLWHES